MQTQVSVHADTVQATVAILEDHDETVRCICKELEEAGKIVKVAKSLDGFEKLVKSPDKFDVCSVDWKIDKQSVGSVALSLSRKHEPEAGKVVYSVLADQPRIRHEAKEGGADFILRKVGDNYEQYLVFVEDAAKLGLSRHIKRRMGDLGHLVDIHLTPGGQDETILFEEARRVGLEKAFDREDDELIDHLKRRGWFLSFDADFYANLPQEQKFALLFDYVGGTPEDLVRMIESDLSVANNALSGKYADNQLEDNMDALLSILAYVLTLSNSEPELMPHYWRVTKLFDASMSSPPWDASGLFEYLKETGMVGIEQALYWIRSH
jgi:hypothetical protein